MWISRDWQHQMHSSAVVNRLLRALNAVARAALDAVPPYSRIEGRLMDKEASRDGSFYILVDEEMVEVDSLTFETLMVGEALRIRATRDNRAISIDRLMP